MSYSGDPSLAQDVQERISNTFQQTLDLVTENRDQEAVVGCEFILRMDPEFQPAKTLVSRLKSGQRPVRIDDLRTSPAAADDLSSLDDLDDLSDLGDLDDLSYDGEPVAESAAAIAAGPPAAASGLATVLEDLLAKRNLEQILQIAETQKQTVAGDPEVQRLVGEARALMESDAYVQAFLESAAEARDAGRLEEMEKHLEKARALDPAHPQVRAFAAEPAPEVPAPEAPDEVLTFDDEAVYLEEGSLGVAAAADDDLRVLQQQSLSLEGEAAPEQVASDLARDPRQTKPMDAVTSDGGAADTSPAVEEPLAVAPPGEDALDDLGADLFADEGPEAELLEDDAAALAEFEAELFDGDSTAPEEAEAQDLGAELELDDVTFDDGAGIPAPAAEEPSEDGDRVSQLLAEGQDAFDRGEYQAAIDVWSRIFLIDIDNQEASQKIEEARSKKAEIERQAEELFHLAAGQIESMSLEEAKGTLGGVLELLPSHSLAREYLGQLEAGKVPTVSPVSEADASPIASDDDLEALAGTVEEGPSLEAAVQRDRIVVVKKTDMRIVALGAVVLLAVLGAGGFLFLKWDVLFPNQAAPPTMAQQPRKVDPIERATKMHEGDQTENAILLLERIQPQDPVYEDAQALIAQWKALVEAPPEPADTGPSEEQLKRYNLLLGAAREAYGKNRFLRARRYFDMAVKLLPLGADDQTLARECDDRLRPLEDQITMFNEGQYAAIIPDLWRKREADPGNLDVERLLVDSYYNLALTDLQRGKADQAAKKMKEALEIQPDNLEIERLQLFAQTYAQRQQDLLYRIFVKYLPSR